MSSSPLNPMSILSFHTKSSSLSSRLFNASAAAHGSPGASAAASTNDALFSAAAVASAIGVLSIVSGALIYAIRFLFAKLWTFYVRSWVATITVEDSESPELFRWLQNEFARLQQTTDIATFRHVQALLREDISNDDTSSVRMWGARPLSVLDRAGEDAVEFRFVPATGEHCIVFEGHRLWITLTKHREQASNSYSSSGVAVPAPRTIALSVYNRAGQGLAVLQRFLAATRKRALAERKSCVGLYTPINLMMWSRSSSLPHLPWNALILPSRIKDFVFDDMNTFLSSADYYRERGVPHRRGYLFHGNPGSGKSSLAHALASKLSMDIATVSVTSSGNDAMLARSLRGAPPNSILLLEDIDAAFGSREVSDSDHLTKLKQQYGVKQDARSRRGSALTLSGLLNALDGVSAQVGHIVIMTSNHPDQLDPALLRPGRIDVKVEISDATPQQVAEMLAKFHTDATEQQCEEFAKNVARVKPGDVEREAQRRVIVKANRAVTSAIFGLDNDDDNDDDGDNDDVTAANERIVDDANNAVADATDSDDSDGDDDDASESDDEFEGQVRADLDELFGGDAKMRGVSMAEVQRYLLSRRVTIAEAIDGAYDFFFEMKVAEFQISLQQRADAYRLRVARRARERAETKRAERKKEREAKRAAANKAAKDKHKDETTKSEEESESTQSSTSSTTSSAAAAAAAAPAAAVTTTTKSPRKKSKSTSGAKLKPRREKDKRAKTAKASA